MITIAIDPGLSGACAMFDHNGLLAVFDLPTMKIPGVGPSALVQSKIDARTFLQMVRQKWPADETARAVVESVGTMGGANNAVQTQGSLLRTLGALEAVLECSRIPTSYVYPQSWKKFYGLIDSNLKSTERKAKAIECARRLYPDCRDIARAKDHNRAEAILIGHWLVRRDPIDQEAKFAGVPF
jgi:hypothetical protein